MTERPDAGDVLKQVPVAMHAADTAFDLNVRCHEAALVGFEQLLDDIASGTMTPRPQDLSRRTYFAASAAPLGAGIIRWIDSAEQIDRLIRACTLGPRVDNRFGSPTMLLGDGFAVPSGSERTGRASNDPPGTVKTDATGALVITTGTDDLRIAQVTTAAGRIHTFPNLLGPLRLEVGERLPTSPSHVARLSDGLNVIRGHEAFRVNALQAAEPLNCAAPTGSPTASPTRVSRDVAALLDHVRLAVLIWLSRWNVRGGAVWYSADSRTRLRAYCKPRR